MSNMPDLALLCLQFCIALGFFALLLVLTKALFRINPRKHLNTVSKVAVFCVFWALFAAVCQILGITATGLALVTMVALVHSF